MFALTILNWMWNFIKAHWQYIAMVLIAVTATTYVKCQQVSFTKQLSDIDAASKTELASVQAAYEKELQDQRDNEQKLITQMAAIQKAYDDARVELDAVKQQEIADIIKQYGNDPSELAKQLAAATGFSVILPEDN